MSISSPLLFDNTNPNDNLDFLSRDGFNENKVLNFVTTNIGDLIYQNNTGSLSRLPIGSDKQILVSSNNLPLWQDLVSTIPYSINNNLIAYDNTLGKFTNAGTPVFLYVTKTSNQVYNVTALAAPSIFNIVNSDTYGTYNSSTGIYTIPSNGMYLIFSSVQGDNAISSAIVKNGVGLIQADVNYTAFIVKCHVIVPLLAGDQLSVYAWGPNGAINAVPGTQTNSFMLKKIL